MSALLPVFQEFEQGECELGQLGECFAIWKGNEEKEVLRQQHQALDQAHEKRIKIKEGAK